MVDLCALKRGKESARSGAASAEMDERLDRGEVHFLRLEASGETFPQGAVTYENEEIAEVSSPPPTYEEMRLDEPEPPRYAATYTA